MFHTLVWFCNIIFFLVFVGFWQHCNVIELHTSSHDPGIKLIVIDHLTTLVNLRELQLFGVQFVMNVSKLKLDLIH
jgi:hypothetical protein